MVVKISKIAGPGSAFGMSAGGCVHGTGGSKLWWEKYDLAKTHFDVHGNLDGFPDRVWIGKVREQKRKLRLIEDQLHFLKQIDFDFSEQKRTANRVGNKLQKTFELRKKFNQGVGALTIEERAELLKNLRIYRTAYNAGTGISEENAQKLGVDYDGDSVAVCSQLKASIKESKNALGDDFPLNS
jgi:hypothetical protein